MDESEEAQALVDRYIKAQEDGDLEALVSCWHPDVEIVHPMRPDRSWSGRDRIDGSGPANGQARGRAGTPFC